MLVSSCVAAQFAASEEGLSFMSELPTDHPSIQQNPAAMRMAVQDR
jgi:hypothetical protein